MQCEMCGKGIEDFYRTRIEGTILCVCNNCTSYGKIVEQVRAVSEKEIKKEIRPEKPPEIVETLIEGFQQKIKNKREKLGLKQEDLAGKINEKTSILQKVESGHFTPSIKLARKIEKFLGIQIIEEVEESNPVIGSKTSSGDGFTLADFIKVKKKK